MRSIHYISVLALISPAVLSIPLFGVDLSDIGIDLPDVEDIPVVGDIVEGITNDEPEPETAAVSTEPTPVSASSVLSDLLRPAQFSRVAYCSGAAVTSWSCGPPCDEIGKNVKVLLAGGDDGAIPMFFVAHDADTNSIVVTHQGTEKDNFQSVLNSAEFFLSDLDESTFPGAADNGIQVHSGFQKAFLRTSKEILVAVQDGLAKTGATKVVTTGHSLGGAIALLDGLLLKQSLDASVQVQSTVFGTPRIGNKEFADFVDATLPTLKHVANQKDIVPTVPPVLLGFRHPSGEIHINAVDANGDATSIVACPGQENPSDDCTGATLFDFSIDNHRGPYFENVSFGSGACPL